MAAYEADKKAISPDDRSGLAYYLREGFAGPSETFAETFAQIHGGGGDRDLRDYFPRCRARLEEVVTR
jgi:hypothetical protein